MAAQITVAATVVHDATDWRLSGEICMYRDKTAHLEANTVKM